MNICNKCQANIDDAEATCPECGAQVSVSSEADLRGTDFDSELARANLLRMRGEYRQAQDLCLSVLKRYPNSITAHILLGDINSDQGLLEDAAQWFELALDLDSSSSQVGQKLEDVREQIKERDHISSIEQLGLPESKGTSKNSFLVLAGVCTLVVLSVIYAARHGKLGGESQPTVIRTPIQATPDMVPASLAVSSVPSNSATPNTPPPSTSTIEAPSQSITGDDRDLYVLISQKSPMGSHLVSAIQDPRVKTVTLIFTCGSDEDARKIGAVLAKTALEQLPDTNTVTVRAMRLDKLSYTADVTRDKLAETQTTDFQQQSNSPDAWVDHVLSNEWPAKGNTDQTGPPNTNSGSSDPPAGTA